MKQIVHLLIAIALLPVSLWSQALPDAPAPVAPDPAWDRLKNLAIGTPIVVRDVDEVLVHCLFAGTTDAYLFCNPAENPPGVGYRFDHGRVMSVDIDRPRQDETYSFRPEHNWHPRVLAAAAIIGTVIGVVASRKGSDRGAAVIGLLGAALVGGAGLEAATTWGQDARFGTAPPIPSSIRRRGIAVGPRSRMSMRRVR